MVTTPQIENELKERLNQMKIAISYITALSFNVPFDRYTGIKIDARLFHLAFP